MLLDNSFNGLDQTGRKNKLYKYEVFKVNLGLFRTIYITCNSSAVLMRQQLSHMRRENVGNDPLKQPGIFYLLQNYSFHTRLIASLIAFPRKVSRRLDLGFLSLQLFFLEFLSNFSHNKKIMLNWFVEMTSVLSEKSLIVSI